MTASRWQHLVSSSIILVISLMVTWISFTQQPSEAFLFPRLISVFFVALAAWNFVRALGGMSKVGEGLSFGTFRNLIPGVVLMLIFVLFAAKQLGFYLSSSISFLLVYTLYDPTPFSDMRGWVKRIAVTICFMFVIYGLFSMLLKVQTPRGVWF